MAENNQRERKPRGKGKPFQPGQSGNPGGRPKLEREVVELAREYTAEAIERLAYWMRHDDPRASVTATVKLVERGWGAPKQTVELTGKEGGAIQIERAIRSLPLEDLERMLIVYEKLGIRG